jgi:hypothetical protein
MRYEIQIPKSPVDDITQKSCHREPVQGLQEFSTTFTATLLGREDSD